MIVTPRAPSVGKLIWKLNSTLEQTDFSRFFQPITKELLCDWVFYACYNEAALAVHNLILVIWRATQPNNQKQS